MRRNRPLLALAAIVVMVFAIIWFSKNGIEHIEDTNGADNYTLQTITDENICKMDLGSRNVTQQDALIGNTVIYRSKKFTGVHEIFSNYLVTNRYEITVNHAKVTEGNFKMVLCVDDQIVHTFALNELSQTFVLENVEGTVSLRIAGESANFEFDYFEL